MSDSEIPGSWTWARGEQCFEKMESRKPAGSHFEYIDIDAIDNQRFSIANPKRLESSKAPSRASRAVHTGDVLFSMVRPYLRNIALIDESHKDCIASTGFYVCTPKPFLDSHYLYWIMISNYVVDGLTEYMKGDNSPSINNSDIENYIFPIPPINEQNRIVQIIKQATQSISRYQSAHSEYVELVSGIPARFRESVLQEAIQGRLVPQDPSDEPASVLIDRIAAEKAELVRQRRGDTVRDPGIVDVGQNQYNMYQNN